MSPILVRPVREQLEHDRVVRLMLTRYRRRFDVGINPGSEQNAAVGAGPAAMYPDAVLSATDRGHRLQAVVEVESGESVNHLEALSQWKRLGALRAAFYLYVPAGSVDPARRLLAEYGIPCAEIWSYHTIGDQMRFTLVSRGRAAGGRAASGGRSATRAAKAPARKATRTTKAAKTAKVAKTAKAGKGAKAARKAAPARRRAAGGRAAAKPAARKRATRAASTRTASGRAAKKKPAAKKSARAPKRK